MKNLGILFSATLLLSLSASAQNAPNNSPNVSAQAQTSTNANASASATASQQKPASGNQQGGTQASSAGSAAATNSSTASANAGGSSLNWADDTGIQANLLTTLDVKHSKPGERVVAQTTQDVKQDGQVVLKKGTKLVGHVTEAQARTKENKESSLGIMFDHAVMKGGQEVPMHVGLQALAAASNQTSAAASDYSQMPVSAPASGGMGRSSGGGLVGGAGATAGGAVGATGNAAGNVGQTAGGTVGATTRTAASAAGSSGGLNAAGELTSNSKGVFGLQGLNLNSAASNATQGSVVTSTSQNVHLDSGTQMILQVMKQ
jgi:hypothetical protein